MLERRSRLSRTSGLQARPYHSLSTRQGLIAALDSVVSKIVRKRDGHCLTCGTEDDLTCSHFYKRRFHSTRWSLANCHAQCSSCNNRHNVDPFPYLYALQEKIGKDAVLELLKVRDSKIYFTDDQLRTMLDEFRAHLKGMA